MDRFLDGGTGSIFNSFLLPASQVKQGNVPEEIKFDTSKGVSIHSFYTDDIDQGLTGFVLNLAEDWLGLGNGEDDNFGIPVTKYTADKIFSGKIPALDINFITPDDYNGNEAKQDRSIAYQLHNAVASWYVALRNLAIVGLMIVLVYVGIRILLSSTSSDKAKYKQMLMDWLVAMCLLFFLHYVMAFTITITQEITNALAPDEFGNSIPVQVYTGDSGSNVEVQFNTDLMGLARFQVQMKDGGTKILSLIIYLALVIYTVIFTVTYLKRAITMAFLTFVSPLVALTYPIDKLRDGKAQAFNMWLKEYIYNALLQPFHLIIYTILVGSAMELATNNPIYAIVALASIKPAEKILRRFFGFDQASTASSLGAFAGGAAVSKMLSNAGRKGQNGGGKGPNNNIRTQDQKKLKDPNAPSGVDGFTNKPFNNPQNPQNPQQSNPQGNPQNSQNPQQQMIDAYDENYGTEDWNPQERDAMAREANQGQGGMDYSNYSDDELREMGLDDESIAAMRGTDNNPSPQQQMLDAYDENYGTEDWNPQERDAMAREANQGQRGMDYSNYSDDELREMGLDDDSINEMRGLSNNIHTNNTQQQDLENNSQEENMVPEPTQEINDTQNLNTLPKRNFATKIGDGFKGSVRAIKNRAAETVGNKYYRREKLKSAVKGLGKAYLRAGITVGTTALGTATGITREGLEDTATGAILGFTASKGISNMVTNATSRTVNRIGRTAPIQGFREGYSGKTATDRALERQTTRLMTDNNFMEDIKEYRPGGKELKGKELREAALRGAQLYNYGIQDTSDIVKALKVEDSVTKELENTNFSKMEKEDMARKQATTATKLAKQIHDPTKLADEEYTNKLVKSWTKSIMKEKPTLSVQDAEQNAKTILKRVKQIHKID